MADFPAITHTTLVSLFSDIASAIRAKKGSSAEIIADEFPSEIMSIPSGGAGGNYNIESVDDGNGGQILNITDAHGGGLPNVRKFTVTTDPTLGTYGGISFPISTSGVKIYVVVNSAYRNKLNSTYRYLRGQIFEVVNGELSGRGGYRYDNSSNITMGVTIEDGVATCTGGTVIHMDEIYTLDVYEVTIT